MTNRQVGAGSSHTGDVGPDHLCDHPPRYPHTLISEPGEGVQRLPVEGGEAWSRCLMGLVGVSKRNSSDQVGSPARLSLARFVLTSQDNRSHPELK